MKKQFTQYIIMALAGIVLAVFPSACENSLDLEPVDSVSDATFWKQTVEFKLAANNFYGYLRSFTNGNGNGHAGTDLGADRSTFARGTNTVVSNDGNYNDAYVWIRNINYMLERAAEYADPDAITQYVAEARFFRAYVYFDKLLTSYGGVPLIDKTLERDSPELLAPRNTREETIDFIISDLEAAIPGLPLENEIPSGDKGRVSMGAARAFLGRVCLYEGTWQKFRGNSGRADALLDKSIENSNAVIMSNEYSLFKPEALGDSALKYLFILENQKSNPAGITKAANNEYILAVRYESENLVRTISERQISFESLGADMSREMADMYLCSDGLPIDKTTVPFSRAMMDSEFGNRDNRMRYFMTIPGYPYWQNATNWHINWDWSPADMANARPPHDPWGNSISGYENQQWSAERQVPNRQEAYDYPVIRLAEVYLNYAEAVFERNESISDADLDKSLNLVRARINTSMPKLSNALAATHGLDMREEIRRERAVELQGEGFRMDDLKRWYIAHVELIKPVLGIRYTGTEYEARYPSLGVPLNAEGDVIADPASERRFSEKNYLIPLPTNQIQLNPNLEQNPGWD